MKWNIYFLFWFLYVCSGFNTQKHCFTYAKNSIEESEVFGDQKPQSNWSTFFHLTKKTKTKPQWITYAALNHLTLSQMGATQDWWIMHIAV